MLGRIEDEDQFAEVGRVLNILLLQIRLCVHTDCTPVHSHLLVKVGMDLEKGGDQGKGQVRMVGAQVLEGDIDTPPVLGIPLEIHQQQLVNHHVEAILGGDSARLKANQRSVISLTNQRPVLPGSSDEASPSAEWRSHPDPRAQSPAGEHGA